MAEESQLAVEVADGRTVLRLVGPADKTHLPSVWPGAASALREAPDTPVTLDLSKASDADSSAAAFVLRLRQECREAGREMVVEGVTPRLEQLLSLVKEDELTPRAGKPAARGVFETVGDATARMAADSREMMTFVGEVTLAHAAAARRPRIVRWRDLFYYMERCGADALPIIALISFLVGLILAFLGYVQLHKFGSDIFIADGVAYGMVRVFGPLMVAILCAGRSGSAFASEIGAMKVAEEVDALDTMGLDRARFLVVPKVLALVIMMPILVLYADLAGIAGGFFVGVFGMEIPAPIYVSRTLSILTLWRVGSGLVKSLVFAVLVGGVGCLRGLQTKQGPQAVGEVTTSAVVSALFLIVIAEATFSVTFHYLDL